MEVESEKQKEWRRLQTAAGLGLLFVFAITLVYFVLEMANIDQGPLSVFPRRLESLPGIIFAPFLHGSGLHLFSNAVPLFVLTTGTFLLYPTIGWRLLLLVLVGGGAALWLFARPSYHLGASGINYGLVSFLFASGVIRREPPAMALALIVVFLYGGMVWGVLPTQPGVSYESHLYSAIAGLTGAWWWRGLDRPTPPNPDDDPDFFFEDDSY